MKRLFTMLIIFLIPALIFAAKASPTAVPGANTDTTKTVKIAVVVPVKMINGAAIPQIDGELTDYIVGASYIYNKNKTKALVILEVPEANVSAVKTILKSLKKEIAKADENRIEREFKGYKTHLGKR